MIKGKRIRKHADHVLDDGNVRLLKYAELFGANASGKSNLVSSLEFARSSILLGLPKSSKNNYCRAYDTNKGKQSSFEFEIKIGDVYYSYGFSAILSQAKITEEWMFEIFPNKADKMIFVRRPSDKQFEINPSLDQSFKNYFVPYQTLLAGDTSKLFLTEAGRYSSGSEADADTILTKLLHWFKEQLIIVYPDSTVTRYTSFITSKDPDKIRKTISSFDFGITDFQFVDSRLEDLSQFSDKEKEMIDYFFNNIEEYLKKQSSETKEISSVIRHGHEFVIVTRNRETKQLSVKKLQFKHTSGSSMFDFSEESEGTIRLLDLLEILFRAPEETEDAIYVVDEISRSLHPQLTYKFISDYLANAGNHVQLVVTTHESHLLDLELLRRDEIWFVDKNADGVSKLYSLDEYSERFDKRVGKAYFDGRYGGVPLFDRVYPVDL